MYFQRLFAKYTGFLRDLKWTYVIHNLLNISKLKHNRTLYRRYGIHKSIVAPIGSQDFQHTPALTDCPLIDQPDAEYQVRQHPEFRQFPPLWQEKIIGFIRDGYMVIEQFFPQELTDALNAEVDANLSSGKTGFNFTGRKIFNFYEQSKLADQAFFRNRELTHLLSFLLGKKVIPFQTLNFRLGSEQRAHSDSIHMTTAPQGFMIATWTALEDCTTDNGPLYYYPGSHRLPYLMTDDYDSGNTHMTIGAHSNQRYEDAIEQRIGKLGLQKELFLAKRGDVLIWHANLLHGGSAIIREGATRKSMVCHYFTEDVICYHEMTQRPALIQSP